MKKFIEVYLIIFRFWMCLPEKLRFFLVGGYNTVVFYALYVFFLWQSANEYPQLSLFLSFLLSSLNSYLTQKFYVFNTRGNYIHEYLKCLTTWMIGYLFNAGLLFAFIRWFEWNPYFSQLVVIIFVTIISYLMLKHFSFKHSN